MIIFLGLNTCNRYATIYGKKKNAISAIDAILKIISSPQTGIRKCLAQCSFQVLHEGV